VVLQQVQRQIGGMKAKMATVPLTVLASVFGSMLAVWALSKAAGFHFNPAVVAVLSAVISAAVTSVRVRRAI
jgi:glycerol uptake facilitator-like aquaporin